MSQEHQNLFQKEVVIKKRMEVCKYKSAYIQADYNQRHNSLLTGINIL